MWRQLGKEGLAVRAPWPASGVEDKLLTREAKFLRDSLKTFRGQAGKAKKGWKASDVLVSGEYPKWKADVLTWMQEKYDSDSGSFPQDFMKQLKGWTASSVPDKKLIKLSMQFGSWMKREVDDVGPMAMEIKLPFDQRRILSESRRYLLSQLNLKELGIHDLDVDEDAPDVPDKVSQNVTPGRPYLWMR